MKHETLFLKIAVILIGIPIIALCIFCLPSVVNHLPYTVLIAVYITGIPFFFILYQALKLLSYIDKNKAFSDLSVIALKNIKYSALIISILYIGIISLLSLRTEVDNAPRLVAFPIIFIFAASVIAVFAAVLEKLLINAIDIKNDNDLTI